MKGTAISVLVMGETPNHRKKSILESIKLDREIISRFNKFNTDGQFSESIAILRQGIKDSMAELIQLERWRRKEGIEKDQPFIPPSLKAKLDAMTEEEREEYALKRAEHQQRISDLEYEMWEKANQKGVEDEG